MIEAPPHELRGAVQELKRVLDSPCATRCTRQTLQWPRR